MARVLLVNKFYYARGGDCTATLSLEKLLVRKGHEVAIFSSSHALNQPSGWSVYFPSAIDLSKARLSGMLAAVSRPFFSQEVKRKFNRLLDDFRPEVVHMHNIHSYLSPYIVELAARRGIRVVWTMHDYKLICPAYTCLREGQPCELCFRHKWPVVEHRCVKNSLSGSLLAYAEARIWNRKRLERSTTTFISPSHFLKAKMVAGGFRAEGIAVVPNFMPQLPVFDSVEKQDYYCYVGRLSPEKGVDTLLEAAKDLPHPLYIIGGGSELERLQAQYPHEHIHFLGQQPPAEVLRRVRHARLTVIPSIWYENNPFSIIESLCVGTPVLGARIGGIPELIEEGRNGLLFTPGDVNELKEKITESFRIFDPAYPYQEIADTACAKFSAETFYKQIKKIYGIQE